MHDDQIFETTDISDTGLRRAQRELGKAALLTQLRAADAAGVTTTELVRELELSKPAVSRIVQGLIDEDLIEQIDERIYLIPEMELEHDAADSAGIITEGATVPTPEANTDTRPTQPAQDGWPRWAKAALKYVDTARRRAMQFIDADPAGAARLTGSAIGGTAVTLLIAVVVVQVLKWAVEGNPLRDLAAVLPARELVTDPILGWLTTHTAGTGITGETAAWTWGITGLIVWFTACSHHLGSQVVLWPAYGVASIAMTWAGTAAPVHRPVAAAAVAIAWSALSLFALNRRPLPRPAIRRQQDADSLLGEEANR